MQILGSALAVAFSVAVALQLLSKIRLGNKKKFDIFKKICYNIYVIKIVKKTVTAIYC